MFITAHIVTTLLLIRLALAAPPSSNATVCKPNSAQNSTTLHRLARQSGSAQNGSPTGNLSASLTSPNNFINFCISKEALGARLMNGSQAKDNYTCNGIPMGMIPAPNRMPTCKFKHPVNFSKLKANTTFDVILTIHNMITGVFTNPENTYLSAPQHLDPNTKKVIGHAHIVIQNISAINTTKTLNPHTFSFFKGINSPVGNDHTSTVEVTGGLPAGAYRLSSMLSAANHQPVLSGIAQRGSFDDMVYFTLE
ncbi:hypothetical protein CROQUDRAFT_131010 [Cronartium quercuum f. sp. fusiforme G11]|uniref:Uncharacterized protein n=1 Tax=Cronartium quercuum f. sp. fusiforme G11 TaxID=708437 RepID=A0A9P6NT48_9BASI|nr:hypothetical protein CROQUDRAFT_131010 [Cronartium quercuum f. sp. fusiforme G11]